MFEFIIIVSIILLVWSITGFKVVKQQSLAIVEVLGKFSQVLEPGLNWIIPAPFGKIVHYADLRIREVKSAVEIKTSDNVFVVMPTSLMIKVSQEKVAESFYKLNDPYEQINKWVLNSMRSISALMELTQLFEDRQHIVESLAKDLQVKAREFGFIIETVLIEQPTVSEEVQRAFNRVVASKREYEASQQEAAANRVKIVAAAKAEAEGQIERAKGLAQSRQILAQSFQENIQTISTTGADVQETMTLLLTVNRLDAMRDIGASGNLIVMDTQNPQLATNASLLKEKH